MYSERRTRRRGLLPACAVGVLIVASAVLSAADEVPGPASVLGRYAHAYSARAPEMLDALFSEDYETVVVRPPEVIFMDRGTIMESSTNMLEDEETTSVLLSFEGGYKVAEGADEGVWRIENLRSTLRLEFAEGSSKGVPEYEMPMCSTLYVRRSAEGDHAYEVFREVIFEGVGCREE